MSYKSNWGRVRGTSPYKKDTHGRTRQTIIGYATSALILCSVVLFIWWLFS